MKKIERIPRFKNIEEESNYWDNTSTTEIESEEVTDEFLTEIKKRSLPKKK